MHEAQMHEDNCFLTLTYDNEHLPADGSVDVRHFQLFMKRLRKRVGKVRYYHCGEYGEKNWRPHYHALLFGYDFGDKRPFRVINGNTIYTSDLLRSLWPFGFSSIGAVTFESAAYVARYVMKKVNGDAANAHYERVDEETGEVFRVRPEYTTMSRYPPIGAGWYQRYSSDVYPGDFVVVNGVKCKPPRAYDNFLDEKALARVKRGRISAAQRHKEDQTPARRKVREVVLESKLRLLPRKLGEDE